MSVLGFPTFKEVYSLKHVSFGNSIVFNGFKKLDNLFHLLKSQTGTLDAFDRLIRSMQAVDEMTEHLKAHKYRQVPLIPLYRGEFSCSIWCMLSTHSSILKPVLESRLAWLRPANIRTTLDNDPLHQLLLYFGVIFLINLLLCLTGQTVGRTLV